MYIICRYNQSRDKVRMVLESNTANVEINCNDYDIYELLESQWISIPDIGKEINKITNKDYEDYEEDDVDDGIYQYEIPEKELDISDDCSEYEDNFFCKPSKVMFDIENTEVVMFEDIEKLNHILNIIKDFEEFSINKDYIIGNFTILKNKDNLVIRELDMIDGEYKLKNS